MTVDSLRRNRGCPRKPHEDDSRTPGGTNGTSCSYWCLPAWRAPAGPATSGQGRKPRSGGAERASLDRMAPVWPHGDKQVRLASSVTTRPLRSQSAFSAETPFDAAGIAHEAGDVLADALVEHGLPRHEAEAEAALIDHGEPAAGELGGADKLAADISAGNGGPPFQSAFGGERLAGTFDVGGLKPLDQILGRTDTAVAEIVA